MRLPAHPMSQPNRGSAKLTLAIFVLLAYTLLVAAGAVLGYRMLSISAAQNATITELLHFMNQQRALAQGVTANALETALAATDPDAYALAREKLAQSVDALEKSRAWLLSSSSESLRALRQDPAHHIDERVQEHLRLGRKVLEQPRVLLSVNDPALVTLRATRGDVLEEVEWMIGEEEALAEEASWRLRRLLQITAAAPFILLGLQALVIAIAKRSRDEMRKLVDDHRERDLLNQAILDNMTEGVIVADAQANFLAFSQPAREILGVGARDEEIDAWPEIYQTYCPDGETLVAAAELPMVRALRGETLHRESLCFRRPDDPVLRYLEVDATPLELQPGEAPGAVIVFADVSDRRRLELEREKVEREAHCAETRRAEALEVEVMVRRRAEQSLREQREELARSNAELAQFAYIASHDLKAPLRTVGSFAELLRQRHQALLDAKGKQYVDFIIEGVGRMQNLLDALLEYSRIGAQQEELVPTDSSEAVANAVANLRATIQSVGGEVSFPRSMPTTAGISLQLTQLFQNLVANGLKFHKPGVVPRVVIEAEPEGARCHFTVRDNGIGIETRFHERIFELFQRLHSQDAYRGTGIGLAICKKIVERHGGKIWVESVLGQGTTVHVLLSQPQEAPRAWERPDLFTFDPEPHPSTMLE